MRQGFVLLEMIWLKNRLKRDHHHSSKMAYNIQLREKKKTKSAMQIACRENGKSFANCLTFVKNYGHSLIKSKKNKILFNLIVLRFTNKS